MENSQIRQTTFVRRRPLSSRSISLENAKVNWGKNVSFLNTYPYASSYFSVEQLHIVKCAKNLNF